MDRFTTVFNEYGLATSCDTPFMLPFWLKCWYSAFGKKNPVRVLEVYADNEFLGVAPLLQQGEVVTFIGSEAVCDFQDVLITGVDPKGFFDALLEYLQKQDITTMVLGSLAPDSQVLRLLPEVCDRRGIVHELEAAGNLSILPLPNSWEEYLERLSGKNRHEIRRKLRRLHEAGVVQYEEVMASHELSGRFAEFLDMFRDSRKDKAEFLTTSMETYFINLAEEMEHNKMLRLGVLTLNGKPVASTFGFTFKNSLYLYNNGFAFSYSHLSTGLLCKVFAVKQTIANGMSEFNFLKGDEKYKQQLGGKAIPLKRLKIQL